MRRQHQLDPREAIRLRQERTARRMTLNDLALATGLSESAIQKMESLRIPITPQHREALDRALHAAESTQDLVAV